MGKNDTKLTNTTVADKVASDNAKVAAEKNVDVNLGSAPKPGLIDRSEEPNPGTTADGKGERTEQQKQDDLTKAQLADAQKPEDPNAQVENVEGADLASQAGNHQPPDPVDHVHGETLAVATGQAEASLENPAPGSVNSGMQDNEGGQAPNMPKTFEHPAVQSKGIPHG